MVSRCAAPSCVAEFKYLPEGRLFQFKRCINRADPPESIVKKNPHVFLVVSGVRFTPDAGSQGRR